MFGRFSSQSESGKKPPVPLKEKPNGKDEEEHPTARLQPIAEQALPSFEFSDSYTEMKVKLHRRLLDELNLSVLDNLTEEEFNAQVGAVVRDLLKQERISLNFQEQEKIVEEVIAEMIGLGPLEPLIKDDSISDILVNTYDRVFVERAGQIEKTSVKFKDDKHLMRIIDKIVSTVGRRVDESQPLVDARLLDGSRVNVAIPPIAIDGPLVSIRKFAKRPYTLERLIDNHTITHSIAVILQAVVNARLNILISGGTGSGKTTLLNAMSHYISNRERIVTIEDAAELQLQQVHVARMECRPPNIEGSGEIRQRELVKNALRMRPDRIIVGEVRAGEAFDMLQAMNTGHDGSMTTVHANSCRDALFRLEQMVGMAGLDMPMHSMRMQIASALNVIIQLQRFSDGTRRLISISEITGMEGDVVQLQEIFRFKHTHTDAEGIVKGHFEATGVRPTFMDRISARGLQLPVTLFEPGPVEN